MTFDAWSASLAVLAMVALAAWLAHGWSERFAGWRWWRPVAFVSGVALVLLATATPLDEASGDGLVSAHVGQHLILGDLAAVLLLIGMPPRTRRWLGGRLEALSWRPGFMGAVSRRAVSPLGAFVLWTAATYVWFVPQVHRAAMPPGPVHLIDQLSFLIFGFLIWVMAFDPRPTQSGARGIRYGGLPWWARHMYAMASRLVMIPPAIILWLAQAESYHPSLTRWRFSWSPAYDQETAAAIMLGFEMLLFALAVVLAFIFIILREPHDGSDAPL